MINFITFNFIRRFLSCIMGEATRGNNISAHSGVIVDAEKLKRSAFLLVWTRKAIRPVKFTPKPIVSRDNRLTRVYLDKWPLKLCVAWTHVSLCTQPLPQMQNMKISTSVTTSSQDVQRPAGVKIPCKNLTATEEFKCSANDLYRALTDREVSRKIWDLIMISFVIF